VGVSIRSVRWGRVTKITGLSLLALFVVWLVGGFFVVVHPHVNRPRHVDAVVVLGPPDANGRVDTALSLINQHLAANLVISVTSERQRQAKHLCATPENGFKVFCFLPDPATTRGEAEEIRRLVRAHGWKSIIVVTSTYHISRARMIVDRCFDGQLYMVAARHGISFGTWVYQYFYQTAGYIKAFTQSGC
jgi:uncharacterized SAM-binding protein YcdF (DUF218 family)